MFFGKALDLDELAVFEFIGRPTQCVGSTELSLSFTVIKLSVILERALVDLAQRLDEQHQVLADVPAIDQYAIKGDRFGCDQGDQHVPHMVQLGLPISVWVKQFVVCDPVLARVGIDVQTVDHADALDQAMRIAAALQSHHVNAV